MSHRHYACLDAGDVVGLDKDGCVLCWNSETQTEYNTGQTVRQHQEGGKFRLTDVELLRCLSDLLDIESDRLNKEHHEALRSNLSQVRE